MIYSSWDIVCDRLKLVIMGHFLPFYPPPKNPNNQNFEKMKKIAGDTIILHKVTKNPNHMRYSSWDMEWGRLNFLSFWAIFCHFTTLKTRKIKIFKKWKKHLEISSIYTCVPQIIIPEIWNTTDIFFCHLGHFLPFYPTIDPKNKNLE